MREPRDDFDHKSQGSAWAAESTPSQDKPGKARKILDALTRKTKK